MEDTKATTKQILSVLEGTQKEIKSKTRKKEREHG